jgi:hypothetical protein
MVTLIVKLCSLSLVGTGVLEEDTASTLKLEAAFFCETLV